MNIKIMGALAAVSLIAACTTPDTTTGVAGGTGANGGATLSSVTPGSQEDLVANVGDRVFFGYNQSSLPGEERAKLDRQATWLGKYASNNVQLAGNCDERGTEEYNTALGQRRASAARDYLVAKGVASTRITTISYGKDRPVALGSDEASYAQNRNAITLVR